MERYTAKRRGILIPLEGVAYLRQLSKDDIGEIMSSLFAYVLGEDVDEACMPYTIKAIYPFIRSMIDEQEAAYQKRASAGAAGGKAGKGKPKRNNAGDNAGEGETVANEKQKIANEKQKIANQKQKIAKGELPGFAEAWEAYPRKQGRKAALAAYEKAVKKGADKEAILKGVVAYADYVKRNGIESQYVKQGSTFFNGEHWGDDWNMTHHHKSRGDMTAQEFVNQWNMNEAEVNYYDTTGSIESSREYPLIGGGGLSSF